MPPANKTTWTKQSAVLLINIVKDVEHKILTKELQVGKENYKTKWDFVAAFLHEASVSDASKSPTSCQYKFWELNRHYKFLLKGAGGKMVAEEKDGIVFAALKGYYELFPPIKKRSKPKRRGQDRRITHFKEVGNQERGRKSIGITEQQMNVESREMIPISGGDESGDECGGNLHNCNLPNGESVRQHVTSSQAGRVPI